MLQAFVCGATSLPKRYVGRSSLFTAEGSQSVASTRTTFFRAPLLLEPVGGWCLLITGSRPSIPIPRLWLTALL